MNHYLLKRLAIITVIKIISKSDLYSKKDEIEQKFNYELFDNLITKYIPEYIFL